MAPVRIVLSSALALLSLYSLAVQAKEGSVTLELSAGTNIAVAASPGGDRLVIDLQGTLWTLPSTGGDATAITDHYGDARQPSWSPDGSRIVFQSYRSGNWHIWSVGPDGEGLEQLTHGLVDDREPVWAPGGGSVVFSSDRAGNYDLWVLDVTTGKVKQLTHDPANDFAPALSPDGSTVYFVSERSPPGVWEAPLDGSGEATVVYDDTAALAGTSASPDGRALLVQSYDRRASQTKLMRVDLGSRTGTAITAAGEDVFPFRAAWLGDGEFVYTGDGLLKRGNLNRDGAETVPWKATLSFDREPYTRRQRDFDSAAKRRSLGILTPAVSPDGKRVVFGALGDLWILEDKKTRQLTDDPFVEVAPKWSPDGKRLIYSSDREGPMRLFVRDFESGQETRVSDEVGLTFAVFSPNGERIAYFAPIPGNPLGGSLSDLHLESGETRVLLPRPTQPTPISWLDHDTVAISALQPDSTRFREGTYGIVVTSFDEPPIVLDPSPELTLLSPVFSPDGTRVAFLQEGQLKMATLDEDRQISGAPRTLSAELAEEPSWTADSEALVFLAGDRLLRLDIATGEISDLGLDLEWQPEQHEGSLVVHAGAMFDGRSETLQRDVDILIDGNRIRRVSPHDATLHRGEVIDASERTVIPGLFEMHAHQSVSLGEQLGRTWLAFGITSVREPGANAYDALERREAWASGRRAGPREFFSGRLFDGNRVYYSVAEGTAAPAHVGQALERARVLDYDMIKTYVRLPDSTQRRVAAFAHQELGIPTSSHEIFPAAQSGMDAVEHIGATSRRGYSPKVSALGHSYGDVIAIIAGSGINQTPTLVLPGYFLLVAERPELLDNRQYQNFYGDQGAATRARSQAMAPMIAAGVAAQGKTPAAIVAAGGRVTAGTDSPFVPYGFGLHAELQLLARGGMPAWQVLRSATLWAAEAVGVASDLGSIEEGKLADLVILRGNPLEDLAATLEVETTIKNGRAYPLEELLEAPSASP